MAQDTFPLWFQPHLPPLAALLACAAWAAWARRTGFTLRAACLLSIPIVAVVHACIPSEWLIPFRVRELRDVLQATLNDQAIAAYRMLAFGVVGALLGGWATALVGRRFVHSTATPAARDVFLLVAGFSLLALFVERAPHHVEFMCRAFRGYAYRINQDGAWYPAMFVFPGDLLAHVLGFETNREDSLIGPAHGPSLLNIIRWTLVGLVPLALAALRLNAVDRRGSQQLVRGAAAAMVGVLLVLAVSWISSSARAIDTLDSVGVQQALTNQGSLLVAILSLVVGLFGSLLLTESSWCCFRASVWLLALAASGSCLRYLLHMFVRRALHFEHIRAEALSHLLVEFALIAVGVCALAGVAFATRKQGIA